MDWQNLLKRRIENEVQYNNASPEERRKYHDAKQAVYTRRLKALRNSIAHLGETNPNIPLEEDMRELQEMRNFHARQASRIRQNALIPDVFSSELEEQRVKGKFITTPKGVLNLRPDLTLEEYEKLDNKEKVNYHSEKRRRATNDEDEKFHARMVGRILYSKTTLPTYPTPDLGGKAVRSLNKNYTKEEYDNMSREDKTKYHSMMESRFRKNANIELSRFHARMANRLRKNISLPIFFSPEHEEEE